MDATETPRRPGRPAPSDGQPAARDRILRAARAVFAEVGYHDATLQAVAASADVSRPAINHHFAGKAQLYEAVFDETRLHIIVEGATHALAASAHLDERIDAFMNFTGQLGDNDRSYTSFISAALLDTRRTPELAHLANRHLNDLRDFLTRACDDAASAGELRDGLNREVVIETLLAIVWGTGLYAAYIGGERHFAAVNAHVVELVRTFINR